MKITEIVCQILRIKNVEAKTAGSQDSVLVRVKTDTGLEGIGERTPPPRCLTRRTYVRHSLLSYDRSYPLQCPHDK